MKENQIKNSWFVSKIGLFTLLFFAVLSIYFQAWMIGLFLCFVFLLSVCSGLWSRSVLKRVQISIKTVQGRCHAGQSLILKFRLRNRSFLPLVWLDILIPTGQKPLIRLENQEEFDWFYVQGQDDRQTGLRQRFAWLLWQQEICWEERVETFRRGVVEVDSIGLQAGDGFGLSAKDRWQSLTTPLQLWIYPRISPVRVQPFLKMTQEAVARNRGQTEDITILKSNRLYQPGDPVKRINWRLLAASQKMRINVYETVMPGCAAFILDLASFLCEEIQTDAHNSEYKRLLLREASLEEMISFLASCILALGEQSISTALIIPAYGRHDAVFCLPDGAENTLQKSLETLAEIDYKVQATRFPYEEFWQISHRLGNIYIAAWSEEASTMKVLAEHLGRSRTHYLVMEQRSLEDGDIDCLSISDLFLERTENGNGGKEYGV